ncbi:HEAT repeat domain-containing protein [Demequina activiva]|uniref:HEAT repeat domain-containing protein n=1 Tax=Demequina activiva TaxID=1582364 RepID=A0A919Q5H8_9MICO|nr:HEAT repeat domain-containing protein [Demequina activiva]GIG55251.1 hypothetical protein Dac01nite_20030 [Demequina activiva]
MPEFAATGFEAVAAILLAGSVVLVVAMIVAAVSIRAVGWLVAASRHGRDQWARTFLFGVLADGEEQAPRGPLRQRAVADTAMRLSSKLRGADRAALANWLQSHGYRQRAVEMMRSSFAIRRARGTRLFVAALCDRETGPLLELLEDRDARVRAAAARALGQCGISTAVPFLVRAAQSGTRPLPVSVAAMSIIHTAPRSARGLGLAWDSDNPAIAAMAAEVAGFLHLTDARVRIERLLVAGDSPVVVSAATALQRLGDPRSTDAIARSLEREDVQPWARIALHGIYADMHGVRLEP